MTLELGSLRAARKAFLLDVLEAFPAPTEFSTILITHCIADRPVFVDALHTKHPVDLILAIPYSAEETTLEELSERFHVLRPTMEELTDPSYLASTISSIIEGRGQPVAVVEIGGYCAPILRALNDRHGRSFLGCVEDTEGGHRRYAALEDVVVPVVSVARSPLKLVEDRLIGPSIMFSVERVLRDIGQPLVGVTLGILGYGKIGSSTARAALNRVGRVIAFDIESGRRALAVGDGVNSPDRENFLRQADVIIGATGEQSIRHEDLSLLKSGVFLASASSRDVELPVAELEREAVDRAHGPAVRRYRLASGKIVFVINEGFPINFLHGAVVGSAINLVQGEVLVAIQTLALNADERRLLDVSAEDHDRLVNIWFRHFIDPMTGGVLALTDLASR